MKPFKVLLPVHVFFPTHFYGTETYTLELAKSLKSFGHDPVILTAIPYGEEGVGELQSIYEYEGLTVHCIDLNLKPHWRFKQTYYRSELASVLDEVISAVKPDLAHVTHLINHTGVLLEVLRNNHIPTIATLTDFFGICFNNKLRRYDNELCLGPDKYSTNCLCCYMREAAPTYIPRSLWRMTKNDTFLETFARLLPFVARMPGLRKGPLAGHTLDVTCRIHTLRHLYRMYACMIAPTDFLYEAYACNGFDRARIRKINFGIHLELVRGQSRPKKWRGGEIRFGYIGQFDRHKGVDLLIRAFRNVEGKAGLVLYGPRDQDRKYADELVELSSGNRQIEFRSTFPREELGRRLSDIDVLVIPSRWYENSPLVLLYALATHTPVIVTDVKGMNEFVKDGYNGFTFRMDDEDHLTLILQNVVNRPSVIESLSKNARYTKDVDDHAREVEEIYKSVIERGSEA